MPINRRAFLEMAVALGATAAWGKSSSTVSNLHWQERRDLYPEGVASGDPDAHSVILWTRRPPADGSKAQKLTLEVAEDNAFKRVVATATVPVLEESDWTVRVLVGALRPASVYFYRFTDEHGAGSRMGRTITAPADDDPRPVHFVFVSCQNTNDGAQNAYRRMIYEDEHAAEADRIGFVLHLGDFIYELVWYPEDRQGMYDRKFRALLKYPHGEKHDDFHVPTDIGDYRTVYRAYLHDPELQDARARWPFVCMWDNHEFSWHGWQSFQRFGKDTIARQTRKVAAMQAFFEYQPGRYVRANGSSLERFSGPTVADTPIKQFDEQGLGTEPNNIAALKALRGYRALRWGKNVDLIITDQRSYNSEEPSEREEAAAFTSREFRDFFPEEAMEILDAGKTFNHGNPPATIRHGDQDVSNFQKERPAQTLLGAEQKKWFLERLRSSKATWKIWGNSVGVLDMRADPQNLPAGITKPWPGAGYACFGGGDFGAAYVERGEIYDLIRDKGITGFAIVSGDRHSFWAGLASKWLPPKKFEPVGVAFGTGSISAPGLVEAFEHRFPKDHALRPVFSGVDPNDGKPRPTINLLLKHGVRTCLEYARSGDLEKARAARNPDLAPHVDFVDMGGHGYAKVSVTSAALESEFVCIPRPVERIDREDGGPLRYRVRYRTAMWRKSERPKLERKIVEGDPKFEI